MTNKATLHYSLKTYSKPSETFHFDFIIELSLRIIFRGRAGQNFLVQEFFFGRNSARIFSGYALIFFNFI